MHYRLNSWGALCLLLAVSPACKSSGEDETTQTDPGTSSPTAATETTPTEGGTETTPTDPATSEPTTGGTDTGDTGDTGDPALYAECIQSFMNGDVLLQAQCQCFVDQKIYATVEECLADAQDQQVATDECTCQAYSQFADTKKGLDCVGPAQTAAIECLKGVSCVMDTDAFSMCLDGYGQAIDGCDRPPKPALAEAAITCEMIPPFMCTSGEAIPETWQCNFDVDCSDESDEKSCPDSFACADGMGYVPMSYKCDGTPDCPDGSDEAGCPTFMCMDGATIPEQYKCDGVPDCEDMSDEAGCPTFMCTNGQEIPLPYKCNGFPECCQNDPDPNCMDDSDEAGCPTFMCGDGATIPESYKCDGLPDCEDGSDEMGCG